MKFLVSEYKDLRGIIDASSLPRERFAFVKRRGRLHMLYRGEPLVAFHRKTETRLNQHRQWEKETTYSIGRNNRLWTVQTWAEVVDVFRSAVASLEQSDH